MNPFDQFDQNPFDQFDEAPQGASMVDTIPGMEGPIVKNKPKEAPTDLEIVTDSLLGIPDAALGVMSGLIRGVQDPINAAVKRVTGQVDDFEKEANKQASREGYIPKTKFGKKITKEVIDPAFTQLLGPLGAMTFGTVGSRMRKPTEDISKPTEESRISKIISEEKIKPGNLFDQFDPQMELPLETTVQQIAERQAGQVGQMDLFGPTNEAKQVIPEAEFETRENRFHQAAQDIINSRQAAMEIEVARQGNLDRMAAERQRMSQAPTGYTEWLSQKQAAETDTSIAKTQELNRRGQQMSIVEDFGSNDPMTRMPEMRIDESGMPIRADLSMELQNLENPLQRNLWGDELGPALDQKRSLTEAIDIMPKGKKRTEALKRFIPQSQRGAIDLGDPTKKEEKPNNVIPMPAPKIPVGEVTEYFEGDKLPQPNLTVVPLKQRGGILNPFGGKETPQLGTKPPKIPEEEIVKRISDREALDILKRKVPSAYRIKTIEEAKAIAEDTDIQDIGRDLGRDATVSGINSMVQLHPKNPILNVVRTWLQDPRNLLEKFSKEYITGENGLATLYQKLDKKELVEVAETLRELGKQQVAVSDAIMDKLGLNDNQRVFLKRFREVMDEFYARANEANLELGFKAFEYRQGYVPGMFTGGYRAIVLDKDGKVKAVPNADTKWELNKALEHYKGDKVVQLGRTGLRDTTVHRNTIFDGFNELISEIAKHDPRFAEAKALADQHVQRKVKQLYAFDVHELRKKGVEGSLGDKPWLDKERNAKEFIEGVIQYLEDGGKFYFYQKALGNIGKLRNDPTIAGKFPNTLKYIDKHVEHVTGRNINPAGAFLNTIIDLLPKALGMSYKVPAKAAHELKNIMSIYMMGTWNPAFYAAQLTQVLTGAGPEGLKLVQQLEQSVGDLTQSFGTTGQYFALMLMEDKGLLKKAPIPEHIREAYRWAEEHGMFTFNELELAHDATKNRKVSKAERALAIPMVWGEKHTRPAVFMAISDLFYKFGIKGPERFEIAQNSTNFAMGDYHFDERPHLYSGLGVAGHFAGALTTYKHNMVTQWITRAKDAGTGRAVTPLMYAIGIAAALQGVGGLAGYQETDQLVRWATGGKTIREIALGDKANNPNGWWDGFLSAYTDMDFQSRLSMASLVPDDAASLISPQGSALFDIMYKAYEYAKYQDQQAQENLLYGLTPSGMKGFAEEGLRKDKEGFLLNKEGERMYDKPRSTQEWATRKYGGIRPLREKIESDDLYADSKEGKRTEEKLRDLSRRMDAAIVKGDKEAYRRHADKYIELGGDPGAVLSDDKIEKALAESKLTERQRRQGTPDSLGGLRKYKYYD